MGDRSCGPALVWLEWSHIWQVPVNERTIGKTGAIPMASDIKTSQLCCLVCACIRHYFPRRQGDHLDRGWLHRVMGVSPPRGSLAAALLAWSPFHRGLGRDGSIIVPDGVIAIQPATGCFVDGWIRSAPCLAVMDADAVCTGGLGASSSVARPCSKGPVRKVSRSSGIRFSRTARGNPLTIKPSSEGG